MKKRRTENSENLGKLALTIGTFDGIHLGHQLLLDATKRIATERNIESAAYTFEVPPRRHLEDPGPPLIMDPEKKLEILRSKVERVIIGDFLDFRNYSPSRFVEEVLIDQLNVDAVIVGKDWRFGQNRSGSHSDLEELSGGRFTIHPKDQVKKRKKPISSTWIRNAISDGKIGLATNLLGRHPSYSGKVKKGHQVGRDLGFPTANIKPDPRVVLPKPGNYAGFVVLDGKTFQAAVHVGNRPSFNGNEDTRIEVHLLDFEGNLYDKHLEVKIVKFLGKSKKYDDKSELSKSIRNYTREAKRILEEKNAVK